MAAETVMDTSSPENSDSRKRPLDVDIETGSTKRSNQGAGENGLFLLFPSFYRMIFSNYIF